MESVELVDGDHRELRLFVSVPTTRPQGHIEDRWFPLFLLQYHTRNRNPLASKYMWMLVVAAGRHPRVCQLIGVPKAVRCSHNPQPSAVGIFIIRRDANSPVTLKGRLTPTYSPLAAAGS